MSGSCDSVAVSGTARRATTPPGPGPSDLAGLGSHLHSPPPEIRVHQHEADRALSLGDNKAAYAGNASLNYGSAVQHDDLAKDTNGQPLEVKRSRKIGASRRPRFDSLSPDVGGHSRGGGPVGYLSSIAGVGTESEGDAVETSLARRGSFRSAGSRAENDAHHNESGLDSMPMYHGDYMEDTDSDNDCSYTNLLIPMKQILSLSREPSVISDGGEQDHLELKDTLDTKPETPHITSPSLAGARSQRNALQKQIYSAMEESRNDDASLPTQRFLPKDQLSKVINTETVFAELVSCFQWTYKRDQILAFANTICSIAPCYVDGRLRQKSYRLIFVILVLVERSEAILSFLKENVSDLDLPLEPVKERGSLIGFRRRTPNPDGTPQPPLECFDDDEWSPSSREQFDRYQWFMLAPFFSQGKHGQVNHYPLHDQHILPFVTWNQAEDDDAESQGGYGRVIMVTMHPAHHKLNRKTNHNRGFAVKQLIVNDQRSFEREREILKKFSGTNSHPHIVSLLATYSHRKKYHFIFDRAQSDLCKFWDGYMRSPRLCHNDIIWIADQCFGIAEGLFKIHRHKTFKKRGINRTEDQADYQTGGRRVTFAESTIRTTPNHPSYTEDHNDGNAVMAPNRTFSSDSELPDQYEMKYGRHGDINPQNILWFHDDSEELSESIGILRGTLKIADFGTAEMNSLLSKSGPRDVANTLTYRPPECDSTDRTIRQSFDIWCLGCVFLEFVTWTLGGAAFVRSFARKRMSRDPAYGNDKTDTYFELVFNESTGMMEAKIKDSVFEFVESLHNHYRCTEFLHNLLNIIMCDMLIVDSRERLSCKEICKMLKRLREDCELETYAIGPSQWRNGEHLAPEVLLRSSEINLSEEARRQIARNLPLRMAAHVI